MTAPAPVKQMTRPTATIDVAASPVAVFAVIADPRTYPDWLVGAQKIRRVDDGWPAVGTSFHHRVGVGPLRIDDRTTVLAHDPPEVFRLEAHIGVFGSAEVTFRVEPGESPGTSRVELTEVPRSGVVRFGWRTLGRAWLALGLWGRNQVALDQLRELLESRPPAGD